MAVYIVSDKTSPTVATLRVRIMTFDGKMLSDKSQPVQISPLSSKVYLTMPMLDITNLPNCDLGKIVLVADLLVDNKPISSNELFFVPTKDIQLPQAKITSDLTASRSSGMYSLQLSSPALARNVYVSFGNLDAIPADNYFDLLPGQTVNLTVNSKASLDDLKASMRVISLIDAFAPHEAEAVIEQSK